MNKILKFLAGMAVVIALVIPSKLLLNAYNDTNILKCAGYSVQLKDSSSGLLYGITRLNIEKPQIIAMDTKQACAVVAWNTDALSTSQVIFAKDTEDKKLDFLNADETTFWGYPNGSAQNNNPQKYHVMIINNLEEGRQYSLRAVSRFHVTALPVVSDELNFVFEPARVIPTKTLTVLITFTKTTPSTQKPVKNVKPVYDIEKFPINPQSAEKEDVKEETVIIEENTNTQLVDVIGAANASESLKPAVSRFKTWFKDAFSFGKSTSTEEMKNEDVQISTSTVANTDNKGGGNYMKLILSILLPTVLLVGILYLLQKYIMERISFFNERKTLYWMIGFILFALIFAFVGMNATALVFLAMFLISLAWYLFSSAMDDLDEDVTPEDVETIVSDEDRM